MKSTKNAALNARQLLDHLMRETRSCPNISKNEIWLGGNNYFRKYFNETGAASSPMVTLEAGSKTAEPNILNWNIFFNSQELSFAVQNILRVPQTPFYLSHLANPDFDLFIVDLFEWRDQFYLERLLFLQPALNDKSSSQLHAEIKIETAGKPAMWMPGQDNALPSGFKIPLTLNNGLFYTSLAMGAKPFNNRQTDVSESIKERIRACRAAFPIANIKFQDHQSNQLHEELWCKQLAVKPDGVASGENKSEISDVILSLFGGSQTKGNTELKEQIDIESMIQCSFLDKDDKSMTTYLAAQMNAAEADASRLISVLQLWWDIYSLPLFEKKLESKINQNATEVAMVIILALRYRLPFYEKLQELFYQNQRSNPRSAIYLYALFLFSHIQVYRIDDDFISLPGPECYKHGISIKYPESQIEIKYSVFAKQLYSSISYKSRTIVKIDEFSFLHLKREENKTSVLVKPVLFISKTSNPVEIKTPDTTIRFLFNRPAGTIRNEEFKLKWVLKKSRFQCTSTRIKQNCAISVNGQAFPKERSDHIKTYIFAERTQPQFQIFAYDANWRSGSTVVKDSHLKLSGVVFNEWGLLAESVHVQKSRKQHRLCNKEPFMFQGVTFNKAESPEIQIGIKHHNYILKIDVVGDRYWRRIINYSPQKYPINLAVNFDFEGVPLTEFRTSIDDLLGFVPVKFNHVTQDADFNLRIQYADKNDISLTGGAQTQIVVSAASVGDALRLLLNKIIEMVKK